MRLDRLFTRVLHHSSSDRLKSSTLKIPILMYHDVSPHPSGHSHPYYETTTTPEVFLTHLQFFKKEGYTVLNMCEAAEILKSKVSYNNRYVVITFDDGYRNLLKYAFPILEKFGFSATVFLITSYLDNSNKFMGKDILSIEEVRQLQSKGFEFGSHTLTHPRLGSVGSETLYREICESGKKIRNLLGYETIPFSHPYALPEHSKKYFNEVESILKDNFYYCGVTTRIGRVEPGDNMFFLKRIPLNLHDDIEFLRFKIEGSYDWVYPLQKIIKRTKHMLTHRR